MAIELDADNERQEMQKVIREHCTDIKADFQKGIDKFKNLCQIIKDEIIHLKKPGIVSKKNLKITYQNWLFTDGQMK